MDKHTDDERPVSRAEIIYIFQAYNRHELTYDELIEQTRAWAEAMRRQYGQARCPQQSPAAAD